MLVGFSRVTWERLQSLAEIGEYWIIETKLLEGLVGLGIKFGY